MNEDGFIPDDGFEAEPPAPAPKDDPTSSLAGGPPMSDRELAAAGLGHGALKTWMGARELFGLGPGQQWWDEFNQAGAPLVAAQRSNPDATVQLPVSATQGMSPEDVAYVQQKANENARAPFQPGADASAVGAGLAAYPVGYAAGRVAAPFIGRALPAGVQGATTGAVEGAAAGGAIADQGERLKGAAIGAGAGGFLGWLLQKSGLFVPRQSTSAKPPRVAVTPEAAALEAEGIPLTAGQRAPVGSPIHDIEQLSAKGPFGMAGEREASRQEWMRVAQNKGAAPGTAPPSNPDLQGRLDDLFRGFDAAYDQFRNLPADQGALTNVLQAAQMPQKGYPASVVEGVTKRVQDALSILGPRGPQAPTSVGDLLNVRSWIRDASRRATASGNVDEAFLLDAAEQAVTQGIDASVPAAARAGLREVDRQYARLMTAAQAPVRAHDTFTPQQYLEQVRRRVGDIPFRRGQGGDLQDFGEAARTVFTEAPPTGFTPGILEQFTGKIPGVGGAVSRAANTDLGRRFLFAPRPVYSGPTSAAPGAAGLPADFVEWLLSRGAAPSFAEGTETGNGR